MTSPGRVSGFRADDGEFLGAHEMPDLSGFDSRASSTGISVRPTRREDVARLPEVEQSAGELFRTIPPLASVADQPNVGTRRHVAFIKTGLSFVAVDGKDQPVGFMLAVVCAGRSLHIDELVVAREHQGQGAGTALIARAAACAMARGLASLTLTTFRHVPWNAPFYERRGFRILADSEFEPWLRQEIERESRLGQPTHLRCAMALDLTGPVAAALGDRIARR
jgi:GNAT superfamily N-acetyltransferase